MSEDKSTTVEEVSAAPTSVPLLAPANGIPPVVDTDQKFAAALAQLTSGRGPFCSRCRTSLRI
jgi:ribonuclease D